MGYQAEKEKPSHRPAWSVVNPHTINQMNTSFDDFVYNARDDGSSVTRPKK
jgi:hypothetical protein